MSKTAYHLQLKGFVGGADFDRKAVDNILEKNRGKQVNVLIDSTGGNLATGLSITSAFKNHGNVVVHFVGLNASAATIASLGASHISIDAGAMYLVHQCSMPFFEWGSLNSDQFSTLIADCEKIKADLDKLDLNVAGLYARKCRKPVADLLALMKVGGWLSAKEALDWGFVDEITDLEDEPAPKLTDSLASAMATAGMPIPNIPIAEVEKDSAFARFLQAITSFFKPTISINNPRPTTMKKTYKFLSAADMNFLNFNSVENVPGIEARAAFSINSATVFKEDVDIVPTIIDDTLSCVPWGGDNLLPFNIIDLIEKDVIDQRSLSTLTLKETLSTCQVFNAEEWFSPELMAQLRAENLRGALTPPRMSVVLSVQAQIISYLRNGSFNARRLADIVNYIRQREEDFAEWHGSDTARLFAPPVFRNKKKASGYFF